MKTAKTSKYYALIALITLGFLTVNFVSAQAFKLNNEASTLKVFGTSNLHDWHLEGEQKSGQLVFEDIDKCFIKTCEFIVNPKGLVSGKKAMDKNTYKALKTDDYKNIKFQLVKVNELIKKGPQTYLVKGEGDLTITNVTNRISIEFNLEVDPNKIVLNGTKNIKMTDYNVEPPTALFGAITTGDALTIEFKTIYQ